MQKPSTPAIVTAAVLLEANGEAPVGKDSRQGAKVSRITTALVVGAMLVALAAGLALAWMVQAGAALAWTIPCNEIFVLCRGTDNPDRIVESSADDGIKAGRGDGDVNAARFAEDTDKVLGGRGDDTIDTADGDPFDAIGCGRGQDVAIFDPGDEVAGDCEDATTATGTSAPRGARRSGSRGLAGLRPVYGKGRTGRAARARELG